ncbi:MAG: HD domain-containing protein [Patescibacteria group bacterium]|jgi:hypothetical protein
MSTIIDDTKLYFIETIQAAPLDKFGLIRHTGEMTRWAERVLKSYPKADREIVFLSIWLHDISHYDGEYGTYDHAVESEKRAKVFLADKKYPQEKIEKVAHCVRAHRCKDVMPESIEAKIVAAIDAASHMTDTPYIDMAQSGRVDEAIAKLGRDYRDVALIPEVKQIAEPFYRIWTEFLSIYSGLR